MCVRLHALLLKRPFKDIRSLSPVLSLATVFERMGTVVCFCSVYQVTLSDKGLKDNQDPRRKKKV